MKHYSIFRFLVAIVMMDVPIFCSLTGIGARRSREHTVYISSLVLPCMLGSAVKCNQASPVHINTFLTSKVYYWALIPEVLALFPIVQRILPRLTGKPKSEREGLILFKGGQTVLSSHWGFCTPPYNLNFRYGDLAFPLSSFLNVS